LVLPCGADDTDADSPGRKGNDINTIACTLALAALVSGLGCGRSTASTPEARLNATADTSLPSAMASPKRETCPGAAADPASYTDPVLRYLETDPAWVAVSIFCDGHGYCAYEKYGESATELFVVAGCQGGAHGAASVLAAALRFTRGSAGLKITGFTLAEEGAGFAPSIRRMFGNEIGNEVLAEYGTNRDLSDRMAQRLRDAGGPASP
jgi:hypothetical protein